jgi:hypothetical protein
MIRDEFSKRTDVSRQRRWQLRQQAKGRCPTCGAPGGGYLYCKAHRRDRAAWQRIAYRRRMLREEQHESR